MPQRLQKEIEKLKKLILSLSAEVELMVRKAVKSIQDRDAKLANEIIEQDYEIDLKEVDIEEECLKLLALYQPVAFDLRYIIAVLKINNDIERIGDLAVNIAERAVFLASSPKLEMPFDFSTMADNVQKMLRNCLDALINLDPDLAYKVWENDEEIDALHRAMYPRVYEGIRKNPEHSERLIHMLGVSRNLERIADYCTNIAEDVVYLVRGEIIRHKPEEFKSLLSKDNPNI